MRYQAKRSSEAYLAENVRESSTSRHSYTCRGTTAGQRVECSQGRRWAGCQRTGDLQLAPPVSGARLVWSAVRRWRRSSSRVVRSHAFHGDGGCTHGVHDARTNREAHRSRSWRANAVCPGNPVGYSLTRRFFVQAQPFPPPKKRNQENFEMKSASRQTAMRRSRRRPESGLFR
jgi:hypothetical protein